MIECQHEFMLILLQVYFFYNFLILLDPAHITSYICIQLVCWGKPPMYMLNPTRSTFGPYQAGIYQYAMKNS